MALLIFSETICTPYVRFDSTTGLFEISGPSIVCEPFNFYKPLIKWVYDHANEFTGMACEFNFRFTVLSSKSSVLIFEFMKAICYLKTKGIELKINWMHEDDDEIIMDAGSTYSNLFNLDFDIIPAGELALTGQAA